MGRAATAAAAAAAAAAEGTWREEGKWSCPSFSFPRSSWCFRRARRHQHQQQHQHQHQQQQQYQQHQQHRRHGKSGSNHLGFAQHAHPASPPPSLPPSVVFLSQATPQASPPSFHAFLVLPSSLVLLVVLLCHHGPAMGAPGFLCLSDLILLLLFFPCKRQGRREGGGGGRDVGIVDCGSFG